LFDDLIVKGEYIMKKSKAIPVVVLLVSLICGCNDNASLYINGPSHYRVKLETVLQADERYISILVGSGNGQTAGEAILAATQNVSEQQSAKGWSSYDLRMLQQTCDPTPDGYRCNQLNLVFEKPLR
jgi:hypothetical protein